MEETSCKKCKGTGKVWSKFIGLTEPVTKDILFSGGSMGMGLPSAVGFALSKKMKKEEGTVYCLMSDGELGIGTTWEAILIANQHKLDNLHILVDLNGLQAMGATKDILDMSWLVGLSETVDGHDYEAIEASLNATGYPKMTFYKTTKGKGVSFMENNNLYHYKQLNQDEYYKAKDELLWER